MSALATIGNILGGNALGGLASVINAIKGKNPEDAAKLQELLTKHEDTVLQVSADLEKAKIQENVSLNETAGENIRAEQSDKYTGRARPTIIYAWIAVVIYNYIITGLMGKLPINMPTEFWTVSGIVITGYVFARSGQDIAKNTLGGAGGSASLFGIKLDSKGD